MWRGKELIWWIEKRANGVDFTLRTLILQSNSIPKALEHWRKNLQKREVPQGDKGFPGFGRAGETR